MFRITSCAGGLLAFGFMALADTLPKPDITVAADGSGDFKTVQAAVESVARTNRERMLVYIRDGVYHEKVRVDAPFVTLRGQSRKGTRIEFPQANDDFTRKPDEIGRAVINLSEGADDFVLESLTAENTDGQIGPHAFTIYGKADRTVIVDCDVLSHGADTASLWLDDRGRYYHANCHFTGSVDFICPRGWCYATNCSFYEMKGTAATWHDGSKNKDQKFVMRDCKFDGTNGWNLARHHADAQFYFLDCSFSRTMIDKPPFRVIYPLNGANPGEADIRKNQELDARNLWGERSYFWNCHRDGGDYPWHSNNLASAVGSPLPRQVNAAWTFAGKWNPENKTGPAIRSIMLAGGTAAKVVFSESVTVKGKPRLVFSDGRTIDYLSGSGSDTLCFKQPEGKILAVGKVDLNGGTIIACEAAATIRLADLNFKR